MTAILPQDTNSLTYLEVCFLVVVILVYMVIFHALFLLAEELFRKKKTRGQKISMKMRKVSEKILDEETPLLGNGDGLVEYQSTCKGY